MNPVARSHWDRAAAALRGAEQIIADDPDGAASRAYYAVFHAVSALFALEGKSFTKHSGVEAAVHRDLVRTGRWPTEIGAAYSSVLNARITGDYGAEDRISAEGAKEIIRSAKMIMNAVVQASPEPFDEPSGQEPPQ
jgi:uncharacterized protein (UPF0332 family)